MSKFEPQFSVVSDGTPAGTKVYFEGKEVKRVECVEVSEISMDCIPSIKLKVLGVKLGEVEQ